MRCLATSSAALLIATMGVAFAAEEIKSGLQVGEPATVFHVRDITGPSEGKTLCYR